MAKNKGLIKFSLEMIVVVVIAAIVFTKIVIPIRIDGESMYPTLHDKDTAIINALYLSKSDIKRFDIIVLRCDKLDKDTYYSEDYLDKKYIEEAKVKYSVELFTNDFEIALKDDEIFVLGDNRLRSADSRTLGTFKYSDIIGKKGIIIYPFSNMEFIS